MMWPYQRATIRTGKTAIANTTSKIRITIALHALCMTITRTDLYFTLWTYIAGRTDTALLVIAYMRMQTSACHTILHGVQRIKAVIALGTALFVVDGNMTRTRLYNARRRIRLTYHGDEFILLRSACEIGQTIIDINCILIAIHRQILPFKFEL